MFWVPLTIACSYSCGVHFCFSLHQRTSASMNNFILCLNGLLWQTLS